MDEVEEQVAAALKVNPKGFWRKHRKGPPTEAQDES